MLKALRKLNFMVAQETLPKNYSHVISHFANSWYVLCDKFNLSTTVKCHIILDHLEEYYNETGLSLVKTSDQLIENMHQYFNKVMTRSNYFIKHPKLSKTWAISTPCYETFEFAEYLCR